MCVPGPGWRERWRRSSWPHATSSAELDDDDPTRLPPYDDARGHRAPHAHGRRADDVHDLGREAHQLRDHARVRERVLNLRVGASAPIAVYEIMDVYSVLSAQP